MDLGDSPAPYLDCSDDLTSLHLWEVSIEQNAHTQVSAHKTGETWVESVSSTNQFPVYLIVL
jgi:hypothetical protein